MAVERTFSVRMVGDAQQLIKEFSKVSKTASGLFGASGVGGALSKLIPSFRTMSIAGTAAFGAVTAAAGLAVKAAMQDAESQELLAQTLKSTFGESEALRVETEKLISQFQISAAVADDQLRPAFGALIRATGDFAQSQKLLQVALDISAGTGRDLESVTIALARASQGSMTALTRLGVPLDQNAVKAKDFNKIVAQLADTFEGQASVKANSAAGRFRAFGIAVDELREQFGMMLLPTLTEIVGFLTDRLIPAVQLAIDQFRSQGVRAGLAYFVAAFGEAGKAVLAQIQAIGQGIFNFLGGVVNALRPLFAAIDLVRSFLAFGKPIVSIEKMIEDASLGMADAFAKFGAEVDYATKKLGIIAAGPMDVVERRLAATTRTATGTRTALDDLGDGATSAGKKIGAAGNEVKKFKDRLQDYTSAAKSAKSASDAFKRSQERVADSQLSVADAQSALAAAEAELARAQQGGSPEERAAAERTVAAAQRGLARAQFNVEESAIAVRDAERRLAEVRADSSSTADDIRRAEIAVEEAHFAVADAQDSLIEDTGRLAEARRDLRIATEGLRDGDAELLPFQVAVSEMQRRLEEASRAHKEALEEETEALNEYREALERVQQMAAMVPRYSAANPVTGLFPMPTVPTPSPAFVPNQVMLPDTVNINVNSSIVNSLQVAQEIQDYLDQLNRVYGNYSPVG